MRVIVCGAGVIGASTAYYLAERGVAATIVEASGVAAAASGKSGGFLALDWCDGTELAPLARASFDLHAELATRIGIDYGYRRVDTYQVVSSDTEAVAPYARLDAPAWVDPEHAAVHRELGTTSTTAQVHPERFTRALVDAACTRGARVVSGRVEEVVTQGSPSRVVAVRVDGESLPADVVVVAMGPWSSALGRTLPLPPVGGLKGYSITLRPASTIGAHALFVEHLAESGERLSPEIYPRPDGEVYVCGLSEYAALPDTPEGVEIDASAGATLHRVASRIAPALRGVEPERVQACYRPICSDGLPLLGPVPGVAGAYVATGHSCWGILNAPASGRAMAELIVDGRAALVDLAPFDPRRLLGDAGRRAGHMH